MNYTKCWNNFRSYAQLCNITIALPFSEDNVAKYVTSLWRSGLKTSSSKTHLSAISYVHRIHNVYDPCQSFFVKQVIKGTARSQKKSKPKLRPISRELLHDMIDIIPHLYSKKYDQLVWKALLSLSYYFCLRAGEAVISNCGTHTLSFEEVSLDEASGEISIRFKSYKHCHDPSTTYVISAIKNCGFCPVKTFSNYCKVRTTQEGPIFIDANDKPINRKGYCKMIKECVASLGLNPSFYNTHSLRIGRATDLAIKGVSADTIKETGRWASSAYLKYIRFENFNIPTC